MCRRDTGDGCAAWENQFLQDVRILLVPQPSTRLRGAGRRSLGCPVRSEGAAPSPNTPGQAGCARDEAKVILEAAGTALTLYLP